MKQCVNSAILQHCDCGCSGALYSCSRTSRPENLAKEGKSMKRSRLFGADFAVSMIAASLCLSSVEQATATEAEQRKALRDIASNSNCASRTWKKRGIAPRSYIEGIALVFARAVCEPERDDVKVVSAALETSPGSDDALAVYKNDFTNAHI